MPWPADIEAFNASVTTPPAVERLAILMQAFPAPQEQVDAAQERIAEVQAAVEAEWQASDAARQFTLLNNQLTELPARLDQLRLKHADLDNQLNHALMNGADPAKQEQQLRDNQALQATLVERLERIKRDLDRIRGMAFGQRERATAGAMRARAREVRARIRFLAPAVLDAIEGPVRDAMSEYMGLAIEQHALYLSGY